MQTNAFYFEKKRKLFHFASIFFPLIYLFTPKFPMVLLLFLLSALVLALDITRHYNTTIQVLSDRFFATFMRDSEKSGTFKLSGMSYMITSFFLTAMWFSKGLAISSWLILIISDCLAAIVGTKFGKPLANGKSLEGSGAFFISAFFISMLSYFFVGYSTSFLTILIACAFTALAEFYSAEMKFNDNLLIPLVFCFSTIIVSMLI